MTTCPCGQPKKHEANLACDLCMSKTPRAMRDEFFDLARRRRGSNSYHVLRRRIVAELAKIHTARRDSEPGHQSDAAGINPPGAAPGRATTSTGAA